MGRSHGAVIKTGTKVTIHDGIMLDGLKGKVKDSWISMGDIHRSYLITHGNCSGIYKRDAFHVVPKKR
jgi:hypothetical protein